MQAQKEMPMLSTPPTPQGTFATTFISLTLTLTLTLN
jgi:hypothetical protein